MRITFQMAKYIALGLALAGIVWAGGCSRFGEADTATEKRQDRYPELTDVPEGPASVSTSEERDAVIKSLEAERDGSAKPDGESAPSGRVPAVPSKPGEQGAAAPENAMPLEAALSAFDRETPRTGSGESPKTDRTGAFGVLAGNEGTLIPVEGRLVPSSTALPSERLMGVIGAAGESDPAPQLRGALGRDAGEGLTGSTKTERRVSLVVHFGGDEAVLRPEDRASLENLASRYMLNGRGRIFVTTTGTGAIALARADGRMDAFALGLRRADRIAAYLIDFGVPSHAIAVHAAHDATSLGGMSPADRIAALRGALVVYLPSGA